MTMISKNFHRREFACKCGCGLDNINPELVEVVQCLRDWWRRPVIITSALRCPSHNAAVGGAQRSKHMEGLAADVVVKGVDAAEVHRWLTGQYPDKYGIGKYEAFTHIDVRPTAARWGD
jgi:uncharacterized protein YcbK (DUF882 family)